MSQSHNLYLLYFYILSLSVRVFIFFKVKALNKKKYSDAPLKLFWILNYYC